VVIAARNRDELDRVAVSAQHLGAGTVEPFVADTTSPDDLKDARTLRGGAVRPSGLRGEQRRHIRAGRIKDIDKEFVEQFLSVNLGGMFRALQAELPEIENHGGAIVNTESVGGLVGVPGLRTPPANGV
jgi:NAD(P)-dependent dehydrogenase (short-subunit alcohol dehydrogenase family)